jgi:hypothetical protein
MREYQKNNTCNNHSFNELEHKQIVDLRYFSNSATSRCSIQFRFSFGFASLFIFLSWTLFLLLWHFGGVVIGWISQKVPDEFTSTLAQCGSLSFFATH